MRLQKYLARAGVSSRRGCEELIVCGRVVVNGIVAELGSKVDPETDVVLLDGKQVRLADCSVTVMLHKPAGYVSTMSDPQGRRCVADLVKDLSIPGLYPVGRLDTDTTGLLLFTTDGELGNGLLHPRRHVLKRYVAEVEGVLDVNDLKMLREGVLLDGAKTLPADICVLEGVERKQAYALIGDGKQASGISRRRKYRSKTQERGKTSLVSVGLREGRTRQIRRMFEQVDHPVIALHREQLGPLVLGNLARGQVRALTEDEVSALWSAIREPN